MRQRPFLLGCTVLLALTILCISALPTQVKHALHTQGVLHNSLHLVSFGVLALLLVSASRSDFLRVLLIVVLLLFGYSTEWSESHRDHWPVETRDVRSDSIGVLCGAVLSFLLFPKQRS